MRILLLSAIRFYQRHLSPRKGFCCAYRFHTGRQSCSALGFRAVRRYGPLTGLAVLRRRLYLCGVAHRRYAPPHRRPFRQQRGDCDCGCDFPCDASCDSMSGRMPSLGDCIDCSDGCDWPERQRKDAETEQHVHIPPKVEGRHKSR